GVLVLDLHMGRELSLGTLSTLHAASPASAIVILTMDDDPAFAQQAWAAGAAGYVLKEASRADLVRAIRMVSKGGRYLDPAIGGWALEAGGTAVLSEREIEVLRLVALGHTNTEIAKQMYISPRTVETHRANLQHKLGVSGRCVDRQFLRGADHAAGDRVRDARRRDRRRRGARAGVRLERAPDRPPRRARVHSPRGGTHMSLYADQLTRANQQLAQSVERLVAAERLRLSIDAAEQARARWARELHDQTLQGLAGARMVLAAGLARDDPDALRRAAETADSHIGAEARSLRDLITELRPAALDDLGLGPAIESLAKRQAAAAGFALDLNIEFGVRDRPRELEDAIYRIIQEALSNVIRHAGAEQVTLSVRQLHRHVEVTVQDDGCGFMPDGPREGFGLIGMRERADLLGGELSLSSQEGGPTCLTAVLPLPA
ncbi:MAG: LuxR C-terminal-related transcriptional regulator, partial [Solirubrobacteraceae bacterium]